MRLDRRVLLLATFAPLAALPGCGGDDAPSQSQPTHSVAALATQVADLTGLEGPSTKAQASVRDLADEIASVMAEKSGLGVSGPQGVSATTTGGVRSGTALDYLTTVPTELSGDEPAGAAAPWLVPASAQRAPLVLGATCVWDVESEFWTGGPDQFGPVPGDLTRFELYESEGGRPRLPLEPNGTFLDVRPLEQSTDDGGSVNVAIDARLANSGASTISLLLAGQSESDPEVQDIGTFDLLMSGTKEKESLGTLDFLLSVNPKRTVNAMEVSDLLIVASVDASGAPRGSLFLQKRDNPRQSVEFTFNVSGTQGISSGDVWVADRRVASMSGTRAAPSFTLTDGSFNDAESLEIIYDGLFLLDARINELFFFSHCVGSDHPTICLLMTQALAAN